MTKFAVLSVFMVLNVVAVSAFGDDFASSKPDGGLSREQIIQVVDSLRQQDMDRPYPRYSGETEDLTPRSFACYSAQGAIVGFGGRYLKCFTVDWEWFTMTTVGLTWRLGFMPLGIAYGQIRGPLRSGTHAIQSGFGLYGVVGGSYLTAGPITLQEGGFGLEIHNDGGTASDSFFGGQLVIRVPKKRPPPDAVGADAGR